jgi:hypothetical protein
VTPDDPVQPDEPRLQVLDLQVREARRLPGQPEVRAVLVAQEASLEVPPPQGRIVEVDDETVVLTAHDGAVEPLAVAGADDVDATADVPIGPRPRTRIDPAVAKGARVDLPVALRIGPPILIPADRALISRRRPLIVAIRSIIIMVVHHCLAGPPGRTGPERTEPNPHPPGGLLSFTVFVPSTPSCPNNARWVNISEIKYQVNK